MTLQPLSTGDMEQVRLWRNTAPETLRTPFMLTAEQQQDYYRNIICDRRGTTRYWGLRETLPIKYPLEKSESRSTAEYERSYYSSEVDTLFGYGGIENIEWENSHGEISILIRPEFRGKGYGSEAVRLFLEQAFLMLNLHAVHGECYYSSPAVAFWKKLIDKYKGWGTDVPHRKYYKGEYWPAYTFLFTRENWP